MLSWSRLRKSQFFSICFTLDTFGLGGSFLHLRFGYSFRSIFLRNCDNLVEIGDQSRGLFTDLKNISRRLFLLKTVSVAVLFFASFRFNSFVFSFRFWLLSRNCLRLKFWIIFFKGEIPETVEKCFLCFRNHFRANLRFGFGDAECDWIRLRFPRWFLGLVTLTRIPCSSNSVSARAPESSSVPTSTGSSSGK